MGRYPRCSKCGGKGRLDIERVHDALEDTPDCSPKLFCDCEFGRDLKRADEWTKDRLRKFREDLKLLIDPPDTESIQ